MSADPAEDGQRLSAILQTVYHATNIEAAQKIQREGFTPSEYGAFGKGVYFALDRTTLDFYSHRQGGFRAIIHAKVRLCIPLFIFSEDQYGDNSFPDRFLQAHGLGPVSPYISSAEVTNTCLSQGYDGIIYTEITPTRGPGGNQVVVFDPKNIQIEKVQI